MDELPPKTKKKERLMADEFSRYQLLILSTLDDLKVDTKAIRDQLHEQDKEIDRLKIKSGVFGIMGGALTQIAIRIGSHFMP